MKIRSFFIMMILSLFSLSLFAESLTLEQCLEMAEQNNPDLKKERLALKDSERKAFTMWNKFLPSLNATGSFKNTHDFVQSDTWNWNVGAGASLSFAFGTPSEMHLLQLNLEKERINYENLKASTLSKVSTSFYSIIAEQKNLEILKSSQELAKQVYEMTYKNYSFGLASELDMLKSKYAYQSIEPQIQEAESKHESSIASFSLLIGYNGALSLVADGDLPCEKFSFPPREQIVETYLADRNDVRLNEIALKIEKDNKMNQGVAKQLPTFTLSENLAVSEKTIQAVPTGSPSKMNGTFSASVNIPLTGWIPGSQEFNKSLELENAVKKAEITLSETRKSARNDIVSKFNEIERIWTKLELAQLNEAIANRSYELSQEGYNAGLVSQTDLENSRQKYVDSRQAVLSSKISYLTAVYSASLAVNMDIQKFYSTFGAEK